MDFDDLLMKTVKLLESFPDRLEHYQRTFRFVSSTSTRTRTTPSTASPTCSPASTATSPWSATTTSSIYSWRGADIRNILEFERDYPDAKVIRLEQNYRSTQAHPRRRQRGGRQQPAAQGQEPVDGAGSGRAVAGRRGRRRARRGAVRGQRGAASCSRGRRRSGAEQAPSSARRHRRALPHQRAAPRARGAVRPLRHRLPGRSAGTRFYERAEVKDALAYLAVIVNPADEQRLLRIVNVPERGLGQTTIGAPAGATPQTLGETAVERDRARRRRARPDGRRASGFARRSRAVVNAWRAAASASRRWPRSCAACSTRAATRRRCKAQKHARGRGPHREPRGARRRGRRVRPARRGAQRSTASCRRSRSTRTSTPWSTRAS